MAVIKATIKKQAQRLAKVKTELIITNPFWAVLALQCEYILTENVPTAATDGKDLYFNPAYIKPLSNNKLTGLLVHELYHKIMHHVLRVETRHKKLFNIAADYAINQLILLDGFELPDGGLVDEQYEGMHAEKIYEILLENGEGGEAPDHLLPANGTITEEDIKQQVASAVLIAKQGGKLPAHLQELANSLISNKVNWKDILSDFIAENTDKNDITFRKPNRRFLAHGFYMPTMYGEQVPEISILIDVSGSVDTKLVSEFLAEIANAKETMSIEKVNVIQADTKVQRHDEFTEYNEIVGMDIYGRGGTNFDSAIEYINDLGNQHCIVAFTDAYTSSFGNTDIPTVWCVYDNKNPDVPYGKTILIED